MKPIFPLLGLVVLLATSMMAIPVVAQNNVPSHPQVPQVQRSRPGAQPSTELDLSANHRITFAGKADDKTKGELSTLTCSSRFEVSGPLGQGETPTSATLSGTLAEQEGGVLLFTYAINLTVPVVSTTTGMPVSAKNGPTPASFSSVQYVQHQATGSLKMKPGKSYDLLKVGGVSYSLTIAPEPDK
jgi:hypothetical protein